MVRPRLRDVAVFEDTTEAEIFTLGCISKATDATEAEASSYSAGHVWV